MPPIEWVLRLCIIWVLGIIWFLRSKRCKCEGYERIKKRQYFSKLTRCLQQSGFWDCINIWVLGSCSSSWISWFGFWFPRPKKVLYDCSLIVPSKVKGIVSLFLQDHFSKAQKCHKLYLKRIHEFGNKFWAKSDFRGISAVLHLKWTKRTNVIFSSWPPLHLISVSFLSALLHCFERFSQSLWWCYL